VFNQIFFVALDEMGEKYLTLASIKNKNPHNHAITRVYVIRLGLEPKTYALEGRCSIQLSYQTILFFCACKDTPIN
jgi:hypothetical protein